MTLPPIRLGQKTGHEPFVYQGRPCKANLLDFWQWSASNLVDNTLRGMLAEFIVALAIDRLDTVRCEWRPFDLETNAGARIEVKSAAYVQSWFQKDHSRIRFGISPTRSWSSETNATDADRKRQADVYVFALLHHRDQETIQPLNLDQWTFFVMATSELDKRVPGRKSLSLKMLESLNLTRCSFSELAASIDAAYYDFRI